LKRQIISIDEKKCTGCGLCIPNCPEGALQLIDGKARLVSDLFCDGLGACIGHCPEDAITIEEREAEEYDERRVMENVARQGDNVIAAHLEHLSEHGQHEYLKEALDYLAEKGIAVPEAFENARTKSTAAGDTGCPGCQVVDFRKNDESGSQRGSSSAAGHESTEARARPGEQLEEPFSALRQWPVQIMLVPPYAPYLQNANLLVAADCVPFAYAGFHEQLMRGKVLLVGCPKLDDAEYYREKLTEVFKLNNIKSVTVARMEVPCCFGIMKIVEAAIEAAGKKIPVESVVISIKGEKMS
jgi:ferredoxin